MGNLFWAAVLLAISFRNGDGDVVTMRAPPALRIVRSLGVFVTLQRSAGTKEDFTKHVFPSHYVWLVQFARSYCGDVRTPFLLAPSPSPNRTQRPTASAQDAMAVKELSAAATKLKSLVKASPTTSDVCGCLHGRTDGRGPAHARTHARSDGHDKTSRNSRQRSRVAAALIHASVSV